MEGGQRDENKGGGALLKNLLIVVALIFTLNAIAFRYPLHVLLPFSKALLLLAGIVVYGFALVTFFPTLRLGEDGEKDEGPKLGLALAWGLIFTTAYFYGVSFLKLLNPWSLGLFYIGPLLLLFPLSRVSKSVDGLKGMVIAFGKRSPLEYVYFIFPLVYAALPSSFYDTLVFHLGIPNYFLQHSGFVSASQFMYANTSIYYEISLIPAVAAGDAVPRLLHFLVGVILVFSFVDWGVKRFKLAKGNLLILIILSLPLTVFLLVTVKNDLLSAFFIFWGIRYFLAGRPGLAGLLWGFSLGVKYTNIVPLAVFFLVVVIRMIREKGFDFKKLVLFALMVFLALTPLLVKNVVFTGNPVYPFMHQYFDHPYWDASRQAEVQKDAGGIFHSIKDVLRFPYDLSFREIGIGGLVGQLFLIFIPFYFLLAQRRRQGGGSEGESERDLKKDYFFLVFALVVLLLGPSVKMSIRCWYIAFLFLSLYVAWVYENVGSRILKVIFFVIIGLNFLTSFAFHERFYMSHYLLSGKMDMESYKGHTFPTYPAISFVNKEVAKMEGGESVKTLIIGESRNYYLKTPYEVATPYDYSILKRYLRGGSREEWLAALKKDGIVYIIFNAKEFKRLSDGYKRLSAEEIKRFRVLLKGLKPLFDGGGIYVMKI